MLSPHAMMKLTTSRQLVALIGCHPCGERKKYNSFIFTCGCLWCQNGTYVVLRYRDVFGGNAKLPITLRHGSLLLSLVSVSFLYLITYSEY